MRDEQRIAHEQFLDWWLRRRCGRSRAAENGMSTAASIAGTHERGDLPSALPCSAGVLAFLRRRRRCVRLAAAWLRLVHGDETAVLLVLANRQGRG